MVSRAPRCSGAGCSAPTTSRSCSAAFARLIHCRPETRPVTHRMAQTAKPLSFGNIHGTHSALSDANLWGKVRVKPGDDAEGGDDAGDEDGGGAGDGRAYSLPLPGRKCVRASR